MITVGIDEVGRGCWAGPLVAAAVVLAEPLVGLKDSKKLSKLQRQRLTLLIEEKALNYGIGWVTPLEVDSFGLTQSVQLAMRRALLQISMAHDEIIIDGNLNFLADVPQSRAIVRADDLIPAVSAASIIAKVARDNYMTSIAAQYPGYGFERHVGYGTAAHAAALQQLGVSDIHRKSFKPVRALLQ